MMPKTLKSCLEKEVFPSREEAEPVARKLSLRSGMRVRIYRCSICGGIHIGRKYWKGKK